MSSSSFLYSHETITSAISDINRIATIFTHNDSRDFGARSTRQHILLPDKTIRFSCGFIQYYDVSEHPEASEITISVPFASIIQFTVTSDKFSKRNNIRYNRSIEIERFISK